MKKIAFVLIIIIPLSLNAQLGLKGGINFANVTGASSITTGNESGFAIGGFWSLQSERILGYRTEIVYSKQGFNFESNINTGNVNLNYIISPHFTTINITRFVQIQVGAQMAYLVNVLMEKDIKTINYNDVIKIYNRFDYGFAGGMEIYPVSGLVVGARINISLANIYNMENLANMVDEENSPALIPEVNIRNNVVNFYAGWQFGGRKKKDKINNGDNFGLSNR